MKTIISSLFVSLALALGMAPAHAAGGGGIAWDKAPNKTNDLPALKKAPSCSSTTASTATRPPTCATTA